MELVGLEPTTSCMPCDTVGPETACKPTVFLGFSDIRHPGDRRRFPGIHGDSGSKTGLLPIGRPGVAVSFAPEVSPDA
jgi:hypothetical protein